MFGDLRDFERAFRMLDTLRAGFDRAYDEVGPYSVGPASSPPANVQDLGKSFLVTVDAPGMDEKNLDVTVNQDVLSIKGERKVEAPEGYSVHRRERTSFNFARSFRLPSKVNPERVKANFADGQLRIELEKAAGVQPRQISVTAH
jgi:HSP20 family protein